MAATWTPDELARIGTAEELRTTPIRADGTLSREVPIWVVSAGEQVYVRTWWVDGAYRAKYGRYGEKSVAQMVADDAAATTLRLIPEPGREE